MPSVLYAIANYVYVYFAAAYGATAGVIAGIAVYAPDRTLLERARYERS